MVSEFSMESSFSFSTALSLEGIRDIQNKFCVERDWSQFHSPRNVLLALVGEVGELSTIFQWKGEVEKGLPGFSEAEKIHVGEEMSDVLIYLIRMAEVCQIDLPSAVLRKFELNGKKYPAHMVRGDSRKYNEYNEVSDEVSISSFDTSAVPSQEASSLRSTPPVATTSPENPLLPCLSQIYSYLSLGDIKAARLCSKLWYEASLQPGVLSQTAIVIQGGFENDFHFSDIHERNCLSSFKQVSEFQLRLSTLKVHRCSVEYTTDAVFWEFWSANGAHLSSLEFSNCEFVATEMISILTHCENLMELKLKKCKELKYRATKPIELNLLSGLKSLKTLKLADLTLSPDSLVQHLLDCESLNKIESLTFANCPLEDGTFEDVKLWGKRLLQFVLRNAPTLVSLELDVVGVVDDQLLTMLFKIPGLHLKEIELRTHPPTDPSTWKMSIVDNALRTLASVHGRYLEKLSLRDECFRIIDSYSTILSATRNLKSLAIVGSMGSHTHRLDDIFKACKLLKQLEHLRLKLNNYSLLQGVVNTLLANSEKLKSLCLELPIVSSIMNTFPWSTTITTLDVTDTIYLDDGSLQMIWENFVELLHLTILLSPSVTELGFAESPDVASISNLNKLESLTIKYGKSSSSFYHGFSMSILNLKSLKRLVFSGFPRGIKTEGISAATWATSDNLQVADFEGSIVEELDTVVLLKTCKRLRVLDIGKCSITNDTLIAMREYGLSLKNVTLNVVFKDLTESMMENLEVLEKRGVIFKVVGS